MMLRGWGSRAALVLVFAVGFVLPGLAMAAAKPALVVLLHGRTPNALERSVIDRVYATMIRNATQGKYASSTYLADDLANRVVFFRTVARLIELGHEVDVIALTAGDRSMLDLGRGGQITSEDILKRFAMAHNARPGSLRFVYSSSGAGLAAAWREAGAAAVLSHSGAGELPALFFPTFIHRWSQGDSVARAASKAGAVSSSVAREASRFVSAGALHSLDDESLSTAPDLEGHDINIYGRDVGAWSLEEMPWPRYQVRPGQLPDMPALMVSVGEATFTALQNVFPGSSANVIALPGNDVRIILGKVIPDFDEYLQQVVDLLDEITVTRKNGKMLIDVSFAAEALSIPLVEKKKAKTGQPYEVRLSRKLHFEISMHKDNLTIDRVRGLKALIKLPIVPDGVWPRKAVLDTASQTVAILAEAVGGTVKVVGKADVRARKFTGVDWFATVLKNLPLVFANAVFGAF